MLRILGTRQHWEQIRQPESTKLPELFRCKSNKNNHNQALIISLKPADWTKHHDLGAIEIIRSSILKCLLFQVNKRLGLRLILSPCCLMALLNKPVWKFYEVPSPITYGQLQQQQTAQPDELEAAIAGTEQRPTWFGLACRLWSSRCAVWKGRCRNLKRIRWYQMSPHSSIQTCLDTFLILLQFTCRWFLPSLLPSSRCEGCRTGRVSSTTLAAPKQHNHWKIRNIMEHHHILHHYAKVQSLVQKSVNWCIELQNRTRLSWSLDLLSLPNLS